MKKREFWKLFEPIHVRAEAFCRRLEGNRDDGDDLYQEAVLRALERFDGLKNEAAFKSWFYRIVLNRFKNRRRWFRLRGLLGAVSNRSASEPACDPREEYAERLRLSRLLATLSPDDRALIVLFEIDGWTIADLAAMFGCPRGTIKARLFRARKKLRKSFRRLYPADPKPDCHRGGAYAMSRSKTTD